VAVTLVLIARGFLAVVFVIAAAAKFLDPDGTRRMVIDFGLPSRLASVLALAIPSAELLVAALLFVPVSAYAGSAGALALILVFTAAIAANLLRGHAPSCRCFGQLQAKPAGWSTVARNGLLAALALFALLARDPPSQYGVFDWFSRWEATALLSLVIGAIALVLAVVGTMAFLSLMHSYGKVLVRVERLERALAEAGIDLGLEQEAPNVGLTPGTLAPAIDVVRATGGTISLAELWGSSTPVMLLFTARHCGPCRALLPSVAEWQRTHRDKLRIAVVVDGSNEGNADEAGLEDVLIDPKSELYTAFQANGTPSAVLIGIDGKVASWVSAGSESIAHLLDEAIDASDDAMRGQLPVGADAPTISVPSIEGPSISLTSLRGSEVILLFWNSSCGFCRAMRDRLLAWERSRKDSSPRLVVVSTSDERTTRDEGFQSLVLLDQGSAVSRAFGAGGTPMAVLVSPEGRVASAVVAGADAVFELTDHSARPVFDGIHNLRLTQS
jgi:thiol-disulfide isomerase/thioredoxin